MIRSFAIPVCLCLCATSLHAEEPMSFHRLYPRQEAIPAAITPQHFAEENQQPRSMPEGMMQTSGEMLTASEPAVVRLGYPTPIYYPHEAPQSGPDYLEYCPPPVPAGYDEATFGFGHMPFFTYFSYGNNSLKDNAELGGSYTYLYTGHELFEFAYTNMDYTFSNPIIPGQNHLDQDMYTFICTDYFQGWKTRWGVNILETNDNMSEMFYLLGGIHLTEANSYELGFDMYVSHYDDLNPGLTTIQYTPRWRKIFYTSERAQTYFDVIGYWIHYTEDNITGQDDRISMELRLGRIWGDWEISGFIWGGEQSFAVRQDGFMVYNLAEKHTFGFGMELKRNLPLGFQIIGRLAREEYEELITNQDTNMDIFSVLLMWSI